MRIHGTSGCMRVLSAWGAMFVVLEDKATSRSAGFSRRQIGGTIGFVDLSSGRLLRDIDGQTSEASTLYASRRVAFDDRSCWNAVPDVV